MIDINAWRALKPLGLALILAALALAAGGCIKHEPRLQKAETLTANVFETDPSGLTIDVVSLDWTYYNSGAHIRITGRVRNNSGQPQQAVTLYGQAFDEKGASILSGRSFITPTYLAPGAEGEFEFSGIIRPGMDKIKFIRLKTQARVLG